jgi:hypothetical protein
VSRVVGWLAVLLCAAGCVESSVVTCSDGRVCPVGTACDEAHDSCVDPEQLIDCEGDADSTPCSFPGGSGYCLDEVCIPVGCGDGVATTPEDCDRADLGLATDCRALGYYGTGALACNDDCTYDESACAGLGICGDLQIDTFMVGDTLRTEACDAPPGEVVSTCKAQGFYEGDDVTCNGACSFDTSGCSGTCGDLVHDEPELCDGAPPTESCIDLGYDLGFLGCSPLCGADQALCRKIGIDRLNIPTTASITHITGAGRNDIYLIDENEKLFHFDGTVWATIALPPGERAVHVWSAAVGDALLLVGNDEGLYLLRGSPGAWVDTGVIVAGGVSGFVTSASPDAVYLFSPGHCQYWNGTTWQKLTGLNPLTVIVDASGTGPDDIYLVGRTPSETDGVWHFDGSTLTPVVVPTAQPQAVLVVAEDEIWVGGVDLAHFTGETWEQIVLPDTGNVRALWASAPDDVFAVADQSIVRFDGTAWSTLADTSKQMVAIWGSARTHVLAGGEGGTLLNYHGALWRESLFDNLLGPAVLPGLYAASADDVFVIELDPTGILVTGRIHRFRGGSWSIEVEQANTWFNAIWGSGDADVHAVTQLGAIWHRDGSGWAEEIDFAGQEWHAIWGFAPDAVYAVGVGIARRDADGWELETMPITDVLNGVWGSSATDVYAVGDNGSILHRDALGVWQVETSGTGEDLMAIWGSDASSIWAVGTNGTLLHRTGGVWQAIDSDSFAVFNGVWGTPGGELFITSQQGLLYHRDGVHLSPMTPYGGIAALTGATGVNMGKNVLFVGEGRLLRLDRSTTWLAP